TRNAFVCRRAMSSRRASSRADDIPWLSGVAVCQSKGGAGSPALAGPPVPAAAASTKTIVGIRRIAQYSRGQDSGRHVPGFPSFGGRRSRTVLKAAAAAGAVRSLTAQVGMVVCADAVPADAIRVGLRGGQPVRLVLAEPLYHLAPTRRA